MKPQSESNSLNFDAIVSTISKECVWEKLIDLYWVPAHMIWVDNQLIMLCNPDINGNDTDDELDPEPFLNLKKDHKFLPPLSQCASSFHPTMKTLYMFGGSYSSRNLNTRFNWCYLVWKFDLDKDRGDLVKCTGDIPAHTRNPCSCIHKNIMYTFSGRSQSVMLNALHSLDLETYKWTLLSVKSGPSGRIYSNITYFSNKLYVFGGKDHFTQTRFSDLWCFDLQLKKWTEMIPFGMIPPTIASQSCDLYRNSMIIFGGKHGNLPRSDLYEYNLVFNEFKKIQAGEDFPAGRYWHGHCIRKDSGELFVAGGFDDMTYFEDLWRIRLPLTETTFSIRYQLFFKNVNHYTDCLVRFQK